MYTQKIGTEIKIETRIFMYGTFMYMDIYVQDNDVHGHLCT